MIKIAAMEERFWHVSWQLLMKPIEWTLVELETTGVVTAQARRHAVRFRALTETAAAVALAVTSAAAHLPSCLAVFVSVFVSIKEQEMNRPRRDVRTCMLFSYVLCSYSSSVRSTNHGPGMSRHPHVIGSMPPATSRVLLLGKKMQAVRFWYVLPVWKVASHTRARERAHFRGNVTILISSTV